MNTITCRGLAGLLLFTLLATLFVLPERVLASNDHAFVDLEVGQWYEVMLAEQSGQGHPNAPGSYTELAPVEFTPSNGELAAGATAWQGVGYLHGWGNYPWKIEVKITDDHFSGMGVTVRARTDGTGGQILTTTYADFWQSGEALFHHNWINLGWKLHFANGLHTPAGSASETVTVQISEASV